MDVLALLSANAALIRLTEPLHNYSTEKKLEIYEEVLQLHR